MSPRILAVLAIAGGALAVTACGQGGAPGASVAAPAAQAIAAAPAPHAAAPVAAPAAIAAPVAAAPAAPHGASAASSKQLVVHGYAGPVPIGWAPAAPSSSMRVAQFSLPAAAGAEAGELAVYFFPPGQGGSHDANIARWASQFAGADGKPGTPEVVTSRNGATEVTLVELRGSYARGVGMGPSGEAKPGQTLMIAMVETASGRITLQMYGPSKAVSAQRAAFVALARGLHRA